MLSSAALDAVGIDDLVVDGIERDERGRPTGRLFRLDDVLRTRVGPDGPSRADLAAVGRELAGYGVTAVTDLTATEDPTQIELLAAARRDGALPFDVVVTGGPGLPTGAGEELGRGPVKFLLDDARLPTPRRARRRLPHRPPPRSADRRALRDPRRARRRPRPRSTTSGSGPATASSTAR